jgi:iron-sulfur cluster repair protein YtfE (RIC family)
MIKSSWTVNETIQRLPESLPILNSLGLDTCCGGGKTLSEAARSHGIDEAALLASLETIERNEALPGDQKDEHRCQCGCGHGNR